MWKRVAFVLPTLLLFLWPTSVWADVHDPGQGTVHVGGKSGPVTTQGTAGFNPTGTTAAADSRTQSSGPGPAQGSSGTPGSSGDTTFRQIPYNAVPSLDISIRQAATLLEG
jgi:hypothetical protein